MEKRKTAEARPKFLGETLTFDDVLLVPQYSEVLPREVNISSQFTRGLRLNTPIVSAAMDTVTEKQLAIAIARQGGIGIIHKNMTIGCKTLRKWDDYRPRDAPRGRDHGRRARVDAQIFDWWHPNCR
jgi:IMP dehydrogenase / GMP reductase domain